MPNPFVHENFHFRDKKCHFTLTRAKTIFATVLQLGGRPSKATRHSELRMICEQTAVCRRMVFLSLCLGSVWPVECQSKTQHASARSASPDLSGIIGNLGT